MSCNFVTNKEQFELVCYLMQKNVFEIIFFFKRNLLAKRSEWHTLPFTEVDRFLGLYVSFYRKFYSVYKHDNFRKRLYGSSQCPTYQEFWGNFCFWYNFIELKLNFPEKKPSNNMNSIHDPEVITLKKSWANGILN